MTAEIIAIGDELTSGVRLDTNSQWLAERLGELGVNVTYHSTVGDDLAANLRVFREAIERADWVIVSGGLGPTADDLTRQAWAETLGVPLVQDDASLERIRAMFARRKREMPPANTVQALFPQGAKPIENPHGTAPGIALEIPRAGRTPCRVFCLPGVPAEMKEMWHATVGPAIAGAQASPRVIRHAKVKCFGVGESDLEAMLPDLIRRGREPSVGITVSKATITLRVTAAGLNEAACLAAMQPTLETIHDCLGELVFGTEDEELQHAVIRELRRTGKTARLFECGTGGLAASWLYELPGAADVIIGARVESRVPPLANDEGWLAFLAPLRGEADYLLAIGPFPQAQSSEPGEVRFAVISRENHIVRTQPFTGHPDILRPRMAKIGLNLLRLELRKLV